MLLVKKASQFIHLTQSSNPFTSYSIKLFERCRFFKKIRQILGTNQFESQNQNTENIMAFMQFPNQILLKLLQTDYSLVNTKLNNEEILKVVKLYTQVIQFYSINNHQIQVKMKSAYDNFLNWIYQMDNLPAQYTSRQKLAKERQQMDNIRAAKEIIKESQDSYQRTQCLIKKQIERQQFLLKYRIQIRDNNRMKKLLERNQKQLQQIRFIGVNLNKNQKLKNIDNKENRRRDRSYQNFRRQKIKQANLIQKNQDLRSRTEANCNQFKAYSQSKSVRSSSVNKSNSSKPKHFKPWKF